MHQNTSDQAWITPWARRARLVINLPSLSSYEDTLQVIGALSEWLSRCYVLTVEGQDQVHIVQARWPKLSIIELPRRSFPRHAARWVTRRADAGGLEIIHDLFGHLASFCERRHAPQRPYVMVHTQRTTNWGWFERVRPLRYQIDKRYASQRARSLWYDTRILHSVDHITVMGPGHEADLTAGHQIPAERISFIPSETDCTRFTPSYEAQRGEVGAEPTILYVGAMVRAKGLDLLFDLFERLGRERPTLRLSLIGRETSFERHWLHSRLEAHPLRSRITLTSFQPRDALIEAYRSAALFVFPSLFEGSPRALREAISCGLTAVASDIPGHRGIDPQGAFIRFAPPHELDAWLTATRAALDEPCAERLERSRHGVDWLRTNHSPDAVASRWMYIYQQVATERGLEGAMSS